jgi:hypothetical protein
LRAIVVVGLVLALISTDEKASALSEAGAVGRQPVK